MADSWKAMDLNKFVVKDDMIDYVLHMYGSNWQVQDAIADDILDDLLKRGWEKQKRVKYDKRKVTQMKIQDLLEKRIEKAGQHLNKEKQIMHINKGKEKMVMERDVVIIESDTSYDYFPGQTTSDESSDHNSFQATFDESYDNNPFQVTSGNTSDDTLKSSSEDTCSSDCTWEQKKPSKEPGSDELFYALYLGTGKWDNITMDFVTKLPKTSQGYDTIWEMDIREKDEKSSKNQARNGKAWKSQSQIEAKVNKSQSQSQPRKSQRSKLEPTPKNT
ncbi:hypothetical protein Tco_1095550 [Tanacetum coccineum]